MKVDLKNDKYRRSRGGHFRLLDVGCTKCGTHIFYYQKDGPGILKRTYFDRIVGSKIGKSNLICPKCKELLGVPTILSITLIIACFSSNNFIYDFA